MANLGLSVSYTYPITNQNLISLGILGDFHKDNLKRKNCNGTPNGWIILTPTDQPVKIYPILQIIILISEQELITDGKNQAGQKSI